MRTEPALRTIDGQVVGSGAIGAGSGFTATRTGAGTYVVRFTSLRALLSAVASGIAGQNITATIAASTNDGFTVYTWNPAGATVDAPFYFTATGIPR